MKRSMKNDNRTTPRAPKVRNATRGGEDSKGNHRKTKATASQRGKEENKMNNEIIRGNALQVIELVEEVKRLTNEMGRLTANLADTQSALLQHRIMIEEAKRFIDSEKKKCAESIESEKQASIEEKKKLQQEMQRLIEAAKKSQEEESFMTQKCIAAIKEVTRLKGLLARNGIKYKKVK